ncbi:MAG: transglycosylase domain-containing protein [Clostridiales bacterium]|nr:transglycosylase domain-containing protein [Clostridiales bacterium]
MSAKVSLDRAALAPPEYDVAVYDTFGAPINTGGGSYVKYANIPKRLVLAFVSIEDKRFFKHNGIDPIRIAGAIKNDVKTLSFKEGASTINQQLVKNSQLSHEKTLERKIKEIKLALELDKKYSKSEIMEMYLNGLYFGGGIYGVKPAAAGFFGKELSELSLSECAVLAAVVKNPARYSPIRDLKKSYERRNLVLRLMADCGYASADEVAAARAEKIALAGKIRSETEREPYIGAVFSEAAKITGLSVGSLRASGYKIYTFYDAEKQRILADALNNEKYLAANSFGKKPDVMSMLSDNHDGGINAFYADAAFNIYGLKRRPGSAAKPLFVYAPAFKDGIITPSSPIEDVKKTFENGYSPSNYKDKYEGLTTVRNAVKHSSNVAAVDILGKLTVKRCKEFAAEMNVRFSDADNLNIALGGLTDGLTPIEILSGYSMLANGGNYRPLGFIERIYDGGGNLIYKKSRSFKRVLSEEDAYFMTDILLETSKSGTAKFLSGLPFSVASKTGTVANADDKRLNDDAWNLSYTTCHSLLVWQGNLSNSAENALANSVTGGSYPTLTAAEILTALYCGNPPADFTEPPGITRVKTDGGTEIFKTNALPELRELPPSDPRKLFLSEYEYELRELSFSELRGLLESPGLYSRERRGLPEFEEDKNFAEYEKTEIPFRLEARERPAAVILPPHKRVRRTVFY